jgi:signal transduction histidine kinase
MPGLAPVGAAEARLHFLLEAAGRLHASLEPEAVLQTLASLCVPVLADGCAVDAVSGAEGRVQRWVADGLGVRLAPPADAVCPFEEPVPLRVLRTGAAEAEDLAGEALQVALTLGLPALPPGVPLTAPLSYRCVPLLAGGLAGGRVLGALTLAWAEGPGPCLGDAALTDALAARAGVALGHALEHRAASEGARLREQVVAIVSHDLRTPLSVVTLQASALQLRSDLGPDVLSAASRITAAAERAGRMIRDLLDFTRARQGPLPLVRRALDVHRLVRQAVDEVRSAHPGRQVELLCTGPGRAEGDADRVLQLVQNLLGNALQHGERGGPVTVRVEEDAAAEAVVLSVHNLGEPIPERLLGQLFQPFSQGAPKSGGARASGSLGLGLYIAARVVQAHGGTLSVRSSREAGTTFTASLPRSPPPRTED